MSTLIVFADENETGNQIWKLQVVGNISNHLINWNSIHHCTFSLLLYHRSCSSFDFFGIVIVNVCFFPGADFLLNRALDSCRVSENQRIQFQEIRDSTNLWMESISGTGPFLSFPTGKSILGKAIVAPPVAATVLGVKVHCLIHWHIYCYADPLYTSTSKFHCARWAMHIEWGKKIASYLLTPTVVHFMGFPSSCLLW